METFEAQYASMQDAIAKHLPVSDMERIDWAVE